MDNHIIYRNAGARRKTAITEKAGHGARLLDCSSDDLVQFECRNTRTDRFTGLQQCFLRNLSRVTHITQFTGRFQVNHAYASNALSVRAVVSATSS